MEPRIIIPIQRGGKMLAQGHYGCVFDPPLICRGEKGPRGDRKKGTIGKLSEIGDIKNELMAAEIFKDKPDAKKYFILPDLSTVCQKGPDGQPAIVESEQTEKDFGKCDALQKYGFKDMLHYQMEYGGKTLQDKMENIQLIIKDFNYFKFVEEMLEIGAYLALNGLIHNDLHGANILMNKEYHPRLIDFGRAYYSKTMTQKTVDDLSAHFDPRLGQITPECSTQDGLGEGVPFPQIIKDIIDKKPGLLYAERLFGQGRQQQMAEFQAFFKTSKSIQQGDFLTFWKLYWPTVDAWSIGHTLASTLYRLSISNQFMKSPEWVQKRGVLKVVITGLLKASPRKRLDCVEALALYDPMNAVVSSPSGKAWLQRKQVQREKL